MRGLNRSWVYGVVCVLIVMIGAQAAFAGLKELPAALPEQYRVPVQGAAPAAGCDTVQYHDGIPAFIWQSPSVDGDTMQFVRFSPAFSCTLKTVNVWLGDASNGMVGTPGLTVDIYDAAGELPDTLISSVTVSFGSLTFFPTGPTVADFSAQNLVFDKDFCVVMRRSGTAADTMALISDASENGNGRSGEFTLFGGFNDWELMLDGYGADYDFFVELEFCCGDPPVCTPGAQGDWSTYAGSFQRTFRSNAALGNECQLTLDWITQGDSIANAIGNIAAFTNVTVKDTLAFLCYWDHLACMDVRDGTLLWKTVPAFPEFGQDMRCNVTVEDSLIYLGGGGFRSMNCIRVADGSVVWSYNTIDVPQPMGFTRFAPSVIKDSIVYFATEPSGGGTGEVFAFNKYTGALWSGWATNPVILPEGGVFNALASDGDSLLFCGTVKDVATLTNGRLYCLRLADGTTKWALEDPSAIFLNPVLDQEGFSGSIAYENGILYYQSNICDDLAGFDHFPWDGSAGAIDVNLEDGSGAGILWVAPAAVGRALYGGPVIGEGLVYVGNDGIFVGAANPKGVIALNKANGNRVWHNALDELGIALPLTVTCEAGGNPYLFAGTRGGVWYLLDGFTGDALWSRTFSGLVHGTVVLDSQVLVSTRNSLVGNGNGQLASFAVSGVNRPRMEVNQTSVFATNALPGSGNTTRDTIYNALSNAGCADLTINSFGVDTATLAARVMAYEPALGLRAKNLANRMASHWVEFSESYPRGIQVSDMKYGVLRQGIGDTDGVLKPHQARIFAQQAFAAAVPAVLTIENATPATVTSGNSLDISLLIDATGQTPRTSVRNFVVLNNNDPDFFPEDTAYLTFGSPVIPVDAIFGFAQEQDTLRSFDALSQVTNHGAMGVGDDEIFYIEGDNTASMFDGTFIVSGYPNGDVASRTAFDVYDWQEFQPDSFLTMVYDTALATMTGFDVITGTVAQAKYVDSIGFPDSTVTHALGVQVREQQVGVNIGAGSEPSFKMVRQCIINRSATPMDSVIYLGAFMDRDVESGANNVDTTHWTEWSAVYEYDPSSNQSAYGIVKLPKPGTPFMEPNGAMATGAGFYSTYAVYNPDEVYPGDLASGIHGYLAAAGLNSAGGFERDDDMSLACALDTVHLGANDTVYVQYAVFGWLGGGNLDDVAMTAARVANVVAGFKRGDVNFDNEYNFLDLVWLYDWVTSGGTTASPVPRAEQGDVNADGNVDMADVTYLEAFLYSDGPAPIGSWWW